PVPGKVKTRLAVDIGHAQAVKVYQALLRYTRRISAPLSAEKVVFYGNEVPETDLWSKVGYLRFLQQGPGLGERMEQAFSWGFQQEHKHIVIIGSDCAQLTTEILQEAFDRLKEQDAVIGPARDGGYYLLGMNALVPGVFSGKEWSTDTVFSATLRDFEHENLTYSLLPTLSDVDTIEDISGTFLEAFLEKLR
ncbi:MAG: TIGR04282 family arsenosugar biosynthesis glycosyltransferase, partial [Bacteroidota bacterium]